LTRKSGNYSYSQPNRPRQQNTGKTKNKKIKGKNKKTQNPTNTTVGRLTDDYG
jgi:hypothetical protein